jgi:hypothetical protein
MYFSDFLKKLKTGCTLNQTRYVKKLFLAAGSNYFIEHEDSEPSNIRKLFSYNGNNKGKPFSKPMKNSFKDPIDKEGLSVFFNKFISEKSLIKIMEEFEIFYVEFPNKNAFVDALCTQFQLFILSPEQYVKNEVVNEYQKYIQQNNNSHENVVKVMEQNNLIIDLKNIHALLPLLKTLLDFIFNKDFKTDYTFPKQIFTDMNGVFELISTMQFSNKEADKVIREFKIKQAEFVDFLENVSFICYGSVMQIECFNHVSEKDNEYVDYVEKTLHEKQKAYFLSMDKLIKLENELQHIANSVYHMEISGDDYR